MIRIRKSADRGHADHGWLRSHHTFSFADYYDPAQMGFRALRVINEDFVEPGRGFATHSHRDMEIVTWVLEGALEHRDSMGNGSVISPGDIQLMRAGTGVTHSEYNHSKAERVHLMQIWIVPDRAGLTPAYAQTNFPADERRGRLHLVVSPDAQDGSIRIHQDARIFVGSLAPAAAITHRLEPGRHAWLQVTAGSVNAGKTTLSVGDGAAVSDESVLELQTGDGAELLLFDLA
ncbi:MAG TPA: pirin family protein [Candidatus Binatia bacterium]|jgi:hypothetical protein